MNPLWIVVVVAIIIVAFLITMRNQSKASATRTVDDPSGSKDEFVVFDLETTGLDPSTCEIIEIGAIRIDRRALKSPTGRLDFQAFSSLVRPRNAIPSHITRINGITQEMVDNDGRELAHVLPLFLDFIGDLPLVAYNAPFDLSFLSAAAGKQGLKLKNPSTCALKMMRKAWPDLPSYKLGYLSNKLALPNVFNLATNDNHRSLADCQRTAILYSAASSELGLTSLGV